MKNVLIIDAERAFRNTLKERLEYESYHVEVASNGAEAISKIDMIPFNVVLCEANLPDMRAVELINTFKGLRFIVISANGDLNEATGSMRIGAYDYLPKPIDLNKLLASMRSLFNEVNQNRANNSDMRHSDSHPDSDNSETESASDSVDKIQSRRHITPAEKIIGESPGITHVKQLIDKVGPSEARVLVMGASGTGKELVARWIHEQSHRAGGPFIEVNCAAIPSELIESELFGHEKGAFTSAIKQRKGKFEQANGGTLFLDEIGDMSLSAQAKVLRALQEHKVCRVGSDKDIDVNVRVVAATNKNLHHEIAEANFREDLYHRLSVIVLHLPSLQDRKEDIPLLIGHFIGKVCKEYNIERKRIDPEAVDALSSMSWPGNIRELSNVIERLIILSGKVITLNDVKMYTEEELWIPN